MAIQAVEAVDAGKITAVSGTTITDSTKAWTTDYTNYVVVFPGTGESAIVTSSTAASLTLASLPTGAVVGAVFVLYTATSTSSMPATAAFGLPAGNDGQILVADSTAPNGVKWGDATVVSDGKVLVTATGTGPMPSTFSISTTNITDIPGPSANAYIRGNAGGTAYETRTPAQALSDLGGLPNAEKGAPNGVATLDATSKLVQMPTAADVGALALAGDQMTGLFRNRVVASIASAATLDLSAATGANANQITSITGTATVTAVTMDAGSVVEAIAGGAFTLQNGTNLVVEGNANYTCAVGDRLTFISFDGTKVYVFIKKADGTAVAANAAVVQMAATQNATYANVTAPIPFDDTIPQITEGTEILSLSFSPKAVGDTVAITVNVPANAVGTGAYVTVALFDGTANAIAASGQFLNGDNMEILSLIHAFTVVSLGAVTFSVRIGPTNGFLYLNGISTGRKFGGVMKSTMTIMEAA